MVIALMAALLATIAVFGTAVATWAWVRGRGLMGRGGEPVPFTVVVAADSETGVPAELIRSAAVALHGAPVSLRLAHLPQDHRTGETLRAETSGVPETDASDVSGSPPERHFPDTWLAACAVDGEEVVQWVLMDPCSRPSSHDLSPLSSALEGAPVSVTGACPCPTPGSTPGAGRYLGRVVCDLAPYMYSTYGGPGMYPAAVAVTPGSLNRARQDPLAMNRPSLAHASQASASLSDAGLLPLPASCSTSRGRRTLVDMAREHVLFLSRYAPWRTIALLAWLAALPVSIAAWMVAGDGPWGHVALASLGASVAARGLLAASWSASVLGPGAAIAGFFTSPIRDMVAIAFVTWSAAGRHMVRNGCRFRVRWGGVLSPVGDESHEKTA